MESTIVLLILATLVIIKITAVDATPTAWALNDAVDAADAARGAPPQAIAVGPG